MTKRLAAIFATALLVLLAGCANTRVMPFKDASERLEDKKHPVYLMTVTLENKYRASFQPRLESIILDRKTGAGQTESETFFIDMDGFYEDTSIPSGRSYAVRMELPPGDYQMRALTADSYSLLFNAKFHIPVYAPLTVREGRGVFYLGNVRATMRQRKEGEFAAGPSIPLIAQEASGVAAGTFDVVIADRQKTDEALFRSKFPALAHAPIRKAVLAPFDRARVQKALDAQAAR